MSRLKSIFLPIGSAILLKLGWPQDGFSWIFLIAFIPVLRAVFTSKNGWQAFLIAYFFFFAFLLLYNIPLFGENNYPFALYTGLLIIPLFWSLPFLGTYLLFKFRSLLSALLFFPLLYVAQEVFQYHWEFSFVWHHLGIALSNNILFSSVYPYLGPEGVALLVLYVNCLVYLMVFPPPTTVKYSRIPGIALLSVILVSLILMKSFTPHSVPLKSLKIAFLQPTSTEYRRVERDLKNQIAFLRNQLQQSRFQGADLLVCPEAYLEELDQWPLIVNQLDSHPGVRELKKLSADYRTPILSGAVLVEVFDTTDFPSASAKEKSGGGYFEIYNGSIFIKPNGKVDWRSKQKLVPFTENLPFHGLINRFAGWGLFSRKDATYGVDKNTANYEVDGLHFTTPICYEGLYPPTLARLIHPHTDFMVTLSNDWSGHASNLRTQQAYIHASSLSFGVPAIFSAFKNHCAIINKVGVEETTAQIIASNSLPLENHTVFYPALQPFLSIFFTIAFVAFLVTLLFSTRKRSTN
jgi:apolipoprotein N-acyltransferase